MDGGRSKANEGGLYFSSFFFFLLCNPLWLWLQHGYAALFFWQPVSGYVSGSVFMFMQQSRRVWAHVYACHVFFFMFVWQPGEGSHPKDGQRLFVAHSTTSVSSPDLSIVPLPWSPSVCDLATLDLTQLRVLVLWFRLRQRIRGRCKLYSSHGWPWTASVEIQPISIIHFPVAVSFCNFFKSWPYRGLSIGGSYSYVPSEIPPFLVLFLLSRIPMKDLNTLKIGWDQMTVMSTALLLLCSCAVDSWVMFLIWQRERITSEMCTATQQKEAVLGDSMNLIFFFFNI